MGCLLVLLGLAAGEQVGAQAQVNARVIDMATSRPVADAIVEATWRMASVVTRSAGQTRSDGGGVARLSVEPGTYRLRVRRIGFEERITVPLTVSAESPLEITILLRPNIVQLDTIRAVSLYSGQSSAFAERIRTASGTFITGADVKKKGLQGMEQALTSVPGMRMVQIDDGPPKLVSRAFSLGGCGQRQPKFFLNGSSSFQLTEAEVFALSIQEIWAVEVYQSAAGLPPEYSPSDAFCGLVIIWTKKPPL